ncbi:MAG: DUF3047 domain-containing protein [Pseudomonadota bacterium]|nr:DUF3047 domain-containing protein [Pseudomonadota bacterium]
MRAFDVRHSTPWVLALAMAATVPLGHAQGVALAAFSEAPVGAAPPAWKFATLPNKQPTRFDVVDLGGVHVLKVQADDSYGTLIHALRTPVTAQATLAWRWRMEQLNDAADIRQRSGDDSPAKICVFFAFEASRLSFGERAKLALAKTTTGQEVPAETLCYVWDNKVAVDTGLQNAFTSRIRMIVVDSGAAKVGQWVAQRRNLAADYQRMFGDESDGKIPEITGVAVSADADNTHGHSVAYVGDVTLAP